MTSWLEKILPSIHSDYKRNSNVPEGLWSKCTSCEAILYRPELERALFVCPKCDSHLRLTARQRLEFFLDKDNQKEEIAAQIKPADVLKFKDSKKYKDRLQSAQKTTGETDALIIVRGCLKNMPVVVAVFEFDFMGGSMGSAVGAKFVLGVEESIRFNCPFICFSASGGARMQEALYSLFQMSKTSAALTRLKTQKIPYISVMTDPVFGGVCASLAMLGDLNIAEPNALIGFAGPRVIEQTVRQKLPAGFQRSEFLLQHGVLDMIVHRHQMRDVLASLLNKLYFINSSLNANTLFENTSNEARNLSLGEDSGLVNEETEELLNTASKDKQQNDLANFTSVDGRGESESAGISSSELSNES